MKLTYWTFAFLSLAWIVPATAQDPPAESSATQSASPAEKAELEGRWTEAVKLRKEAFAGQATRRNAAEYLEALSTAGLDDQVIAEAGRIAGQFPGWSRPAILSARSSARLGRPLVGIEHLASMSGSASAQAERARLLFAAGRRDEAVKIFQDLTKSSRRSSAEDIWAQAHAAWGTGKFEQASQWFEQAYRESLDYMDARLDLARLFQEKYQEILAQEELTEARKLSPRNPDVALASAHVALEAGRLSQAELEAKNVLSVRAKDAAASTVLATLSLVADAPKEAEDWLKDPLAKTPGDHRARSVLAAAYYLEGDSTGWVRERDRVLKEDPKYFDVYLGLANILEMSKRNDEAFALYNTILARDHDNPAALIGKGLLAMREGEEKQARDWLEAGFKGDPFNMRAYNQLTFLDSLDTYATLKSEHFVFRYRAASDSLLIPLLEQGLETTYRELTDRHGWKPTQPTVIEVAPSHDLFSARVAGMAWIDGIPAVCFGDVIAMDSPRTLAGTANWEEILRHEFGHVLALGMTKKRVPHWFTEGLSVCMERYPRGPIWDQNLAAAYQDGELLGVDSLTIGFTRPKSHTQRLLAYHESYLIVNDLIARHGWDSIPAILRALGEGKSFPEALNKATGESYATFRTRALQLVREKGARVPMWPRPDPSRLRQIKQAAKARPNDPAVLEKLSIAMFQLGAKDDLPDVLKKLLEVSPNSAVGHGILGLTQIGEKTGDHGRAELLAAAKAGTKDIPVLTSLAEQEVALGDTSSALTRYQRVLELYPEFTPAREARAQLLNARGDTNGARQEYRTLIQKDGTAGTAAIELARLELNQEDGKDAADALDYAMQVFPMDANVLALRAQAFILQKRSKDAFVLLERARKLDVRNVEVMVGMASYYLDQGDAEEAVYFANLALKYDPDHPRAQALRNRAARQ